ncbi:MAG: type II toxin-antitoxin system death-on-curing family toxin [Myxococcales bacterium]
MDTTLYLSLEEVLTLHTALIARHGGAPGVRDKGLVESALARARSGYYNSLSEQAAALLQSFAMNHAFVDGNKRVAWASSMVFLRMNGYRVRVSADDAERFLIDQIIVGRAEIAAIAGRLEGHMSAV